MKIKWCFVLSSVIFTVSASGQEFWKGTALDKAVEKMRSSCDENDTIACFQYKAFTFLDNLLKGNLFKVNIHKKNLLFSITFRNLLIVWKILKRTNEFPIPDLSKCFQTNSLPTMIFFPSLTFLDWIRISTHREKNLYHFDLLRTNVKIC